MSDMVTVMLPRSLAEWLMQVLDGEDLKVAGEQDSGVELVERLTLALEGNDE